MSTQMISSLDKFDRITAVGILARAALALDDELNPAAALTLPEEQRVRDEILARAREAVGIEAGDESAESRERLGDFLDSERERLIGRTNSNDALLRLSAKGELPSDLYNVQIIPNVSSFLGRKFPQEKVLIEQTVRSPDEEQHYGPLHDPQNSFLISLFAKTFEDKYPARTFIMLVVGERRGLNFIVHQAWRVYPDKVDVVGAVDLIDLLRRFANAFGHDIEVGGERGRFIHFANIRPGEKVPNTIKYGNPKKKPRLITVSYFFQNTAIGGHRRVALAIGVDLDEYREMLKSYGW
jgi:hypothetical protein